MVINHVINNNVVSSYDRDQNEIIVMGKGIGFQKKPGQEIPENKIEKRFILENKAQVNQFKQLMESVPMNHLAVSVDIIEYAKQVMPKRISQTIYLSLTDHINFALERSKEGMLFQNSLLNEVKSFYPSEYLVGEYALALIRRETGIELPIDEAASIALHFVNAEYNVGMNDTMNITSLIKDTIQIVEDALQIKLDDMGLYYSRFVTHLKFLSQRVFTGQLLDNQDQELVEMISRLYPHEYEISKLVGNYIKEKYDREVTNEELVYLTVHIRRIQPGITE